MRFALTDEQAALQDAVRDYLKGRFGPQQVRAVYDDPEGDAIPAPLWKAFGEQGWLGLMVPEENDGFGAGLLEAAVVARAFGAGIGGGEAGKHVHCGRLKPAMRRVQARCECRNPSPHGRHVEHTT